MNWKHGYYADAGYTYGYYPETMPVRLHWAALIQGHEMPRGAFRYLDAGCGQGYNLLLAAAAHPEGDFVGIDFLPEHIAHARSLAAEAGLANVRFVEGDFIELADAPEGLGEFDYAVCHGISTWVAPAVKQGLFRLIGQVLKPGGVFYNSYNTYPGWLGVAPFQHLVLLEQRTKGGALALRQAREHLDALQAHSPGMLATLPALQLRLKAMQTQDPAYLVQEYNNQFWQPVFCSQMLDELAAVKLDYLGTATLPESVDAVLPVGVRELLAHQTSVVLREQLRDYALNQNFRRDLYIKGTRRPWALRQQRLVDETRFALNPLSARPAPGQPFAIKGGALELSGQGDFYASLLDALARHPEGRTVHELAQATPDAQRGGVLQALCMLLHGGWVFIDQGAPRGNGARALNGALARAACEGAPYRYLSLPRGGAATGMNDVEWQILRLLLQERKGQQGRVQPPAPHTREWAQAVQQGLHALGRTLARDGQAVDDPQAREQMIDEMVGDFLRVKWPGAQALGA